MVSEKFHNLGVFEWMQLLAELHKLGYEKMRWFSYISPNGSAMRCHITTQDNIYGNRELVNFSPEYVLAASLAKISSGDNIQPLLREFIEEIPVPLLDKGKGADKDYTEWFDRILSRALRNQELPRFYGEFFPAALGHIMIGDEICRTPPMRLRIISWNIDGLKAHFESLKQICHKYAPDIICLQKVKDSKTSKEFDLPGYNRVQSNAPYAGVATYIKFYLGGETDSQSEEESLNGHLLRTRFRYPRFTLFGLHYLMCMRLIPIRRFPELSRSACVLIQ